MILLWSWNMQKSDNNSFNSNFSPHKLCLHAVLCFELSAAAAECCVWPTRKLNLIIVLKRMWSIVVKTHNNFQHPCIVHVDYKVSRHRLEDFFDLENLKTRKHLPCCFLHLTIESLFWAHNDNFSISAHHRRRVVSRVSRKIRRPLSRVDNRLARMLSVHSCSCLTL